MFARLPFRQLAAGCALVAGGGGAACLSLPDWAAQPPALGKAASAVAKYEQSSEWQRADLALCEGGAGHAIFDTLGARTNAIPMYRIYARRDGAAVAALATPSEGCDGHKGIIHGGITALLFDNTLGWTNAVAVLADHGALEAVLRGESIDMDTGGSPAMFGFTANLFVNYRAPLKQGATVEFLCKVDRVEGRKRFLVGEMRDVETNELIADCTSLFVIPRK